MGSPIEVEKNIILSFFMKFLGTNRMNPTAFKLTLRELNIVNHPNYKYEWFPTGATLYGILIKERK